VYCPRCGREMSLTDGAFACVTGSMQLSPIMHGVLTDRFPKSKPRPDGVEVGKRLARWFCPGCGVPLNKEMKCLLCGQCLRDQLVGLVELHPHRDE
jgi:hypothetical protein